MTRLVVIIDEHFITAFVNEALKTGVVALAVPPFDYEFPCASTVACAHHPRLLRNGIQLATSFDIARAAQAAAQEDRHWHPDWQTISRQVAQVLAPLIVTSSVPFLASPDTTAARHHRTVENLQPYLVVTDHTGRVRWENHHKFPEPVVVTPREWLRIAARLAR